MRKPKNGLAEIHLQIMWNRLIAVVEEQAQTLIRTAFSTTVREAGDLSAGVFDVDGRMLAQAITGTPGHVNSMANAVIHFLDAIPIATMKKGDHYITNDPWYTSGHLHDFTVVTPVFRKGRPVALVACTCHVVDVGGRGMGPDARQVYEEGLFVPIMPLARRGRMNQDLLRIVRANVREPLQVEGDLFSFAASNEDGARRLVQMMDEFKLSSLGPLGNAIIERSRAATLAEIRKLPRGTYRNVMRVDGYDRPLDLVCATTISASGIHVDFAGSSPASPYGINVVLNYCQAYTSFGVKCIVAPAVPNNAGSLAPITVSAPEGSILNVRRPWPVSARHVVGQMLPDVVLGCLYQAVPERVPAEGASACWNPQFRGGPLAVGAVDAEGSNLASPSFDIVTFNSGGAGGRPGKDGLSATAFPSGVRTMPVEATEQIAPVVFWRKEYRPDSGGAGEYRGGLGQTIEVGGENGAPFVVLATFDRVDHPARGRAGGQLGAPGRVELASGRTLRAKGEQMIPPGERLRLDLPGGGGLGDPRRREPARVAADVRDGVLSREAARALYGVALTDGGDVDIAESVRLRAAFSSEER
ncbi:MAG: hydantoinase B/oxoprolinase family protein [Rhodospirillales bacterium]|nr:hydantoinase B/oxoprolinase family protein [Rhodospirillales bacterium]